MPGFVFGAKASVQKGQDEREKPVVSPDEILALALPLSGGRGVTGVHVMHLLRLGVGGRAGWSPDGGHGPAEWKEASRIPSSEWATPNGEKPRDPPSPGQPS